MEHTMNLNAHPFEMMRSGKKTIELRLYDEKRRKISVGDMGTGLIYYIIGKAL